MGTTTILRSFLQMSAFGSLAECTFSVVFMRHQGTLVTTSLAPQLSLSSDVNEEFQDTSYAGKHG